MSKIFQHANEPGLLAAIEANFDEEMAGFGRSLPGAELHEDAELTWFLTGPQGPNGVMATRFLHTDATYINARIVSTLTYFAQQGVKKMHWRVGSSSYPPDLARYLTAQGMVQLSTTTCLLLQVADLRADERASDELVITEIRDEAALRQKREIEIAGFGASEMVAQQYHLTYLHSGFGPGMAWRHYLGWLDGTPVAMASLLLHAGVAGIYGVATVPAFRQRGFATMLTRHTINEAGRLGYPLVVLSPTEMSERIYQRMGFTVCCQLQHYGRDL